MMIPVGVADRCWPSSRPGTSSLYLQQRMDPHHRVLHRREPRIASRRWSGPQSRGPFFYLPVVLTDTLPWSLCLPGVVVAWSRDRRVGEPGARRTRTARCCCSGLRSSSFSSPCRRRSRICTSFRSLPQWPRLAAISWRAPSWPAVTSSAGGSPGRYTCCGLGPGRDRSRRVVCVRTRRHGVCLDGARRWACSPPGEEPRSSRCVARRLPSAAVMALLAVLVAFNWMLVLRTLPELRAVQAGRVAEQPDPPACCRRGRRRSLRRGAARAWCSTFDGTSTCCSSARRFSQHAAVGRTVFAVLPEHRYEELKEAVRPADLRSRPPTDVGHEAPRDLVAAAAARGSAREHPMPAVTDDRRAAGSRGQAAQGRPPLRGDRRARLCGAQTTVSHADRDGRPLRTVMCDCAAWSGRIRGRHRRTSNAYYATSTGRLHTHARRPLRKILRGMAGRRGASPPSSRTCCGAEQPRAGRRAAAPASSSICSGATAVDASGIEPGRSIADFSRRVLGIPIQTATVDSGCGRARLAGPDHDVSHAGARRRSAADAGHDPWLASRRTEEIWLSKCRTSNSTRAGAAPPVPLRTPLQLQGVNAWRSRRGGGLRLLRSYTATMAGTSRACFGRVAERGHACDRPARERGEDADEILRTPHVCRTLPLSATPYRRALIGLGRRWQENRLLRQLRTVEAVLEWATRNLARARQVSTTLRVYAAWLRPIPTASGLSAGPRPRPHECRPKAGPHGTCRAKGPGLRGACLPGACGLSRCGGACNRMLGRGQAVRRGTLDPVFEGSNPSAPTSLRCADA